MMLLRNKSRVCSTNICPQQNCNRQAAAILQTALPHPTCRYHQQEVIGLPHVVPVRPGWSLSPKGSSATAFCLSTPHLDLHLRTRVCGGGLQIHLLLMLARELQGRYWVCAPSRYTYM